LRAHPNGVACQRARAPRDALIPLLGGALALQPRRQRRAAVRRLPPRPGRLRAAATPKRQRRGPTEATQQPHHQPLSPRMCAGKAGAEGVCGAEAAHLTHGVGEEARAAAGGAPARRGARARGACRRHRDGRASARARGGRAARRAAELALDLLEPAPHTALQHLQLELALHTRVGRRGAALGGAWRWRRCIGRDHRRPCRKLHRRLGSAARGGSVCRCPCWHPGRLRGCMVSRVGRRVGWRRRLS